MRTIWRGVFLSVGVFVFAVVLSGCGLTSEGDFIRETVKVKGAEVSAQALDNAIWVKCRAASAGALTDRYMGNDESWRLWTEECLGAGAIELPDEAR